MGEGCSTDGRDAQRPRECVLEDCIRLDLRGLSHTPPTFRGPDHGDLTDFCPRGLVGVAVNAEDERPDNPELLQALLDRANRARRGAVVFYCTVQYLARLLVEISTINYFEDVMSLDVEGFCRGSRRQDS
jgi:hypothetical protein